MALPALEFSWNSVMPDEIVPPIEPGFIKWTSVPALALPVNEIIGLSFVSAGKGWNDCITPELLTMPTPRTLNSWGARTDTVKLGAPVLKTTLLTFVDSETETSVIAE